MTGRSPEAKRGTSNPVSSEARATLGRYVRSMDTASAPTGDTRPGLTKVVVLATLSVLVVGGLIAGGLAWSLHLYGGGSSCPAAAPAGVTTTTEPLTDSGPITAPWVVVGDAGGLTDQAKLSPYYLTLGGRCEYWLTLRNGTLYAVKARIEGLPCAVIWNDPKDNFICNQDGRIVPWDELERWPARVIKSGPRKGTFAINFG